MHDDAKSILNDVVAELESINDRLTTRHMNFDEDIQSATSLQSKDIFDQTERLTKVIAKLSALQNSNQESRGES